MNSGNSGWPRFDVVKLKKSIYTTLLAFSRPTGTIAKVFELLPIDFSSVQVCLVGHFCLNSLSMTNRTGTHFCDEPKQLHTNKETLAAMKELDEGGGHSFESMEDFWRQMGINPNA